MPCPLRRAISRPGGWQGTRWCHPAGSSQRKWRHSPGPCSLTAAAGPVVAVVACAGVLIYALAKARGDAARRAEAAEAEAVAAAAEAKAAAAAVIAEAEAVIAAARLRLFGEAAS